MRHYHRELTILLLLARAISGASSATTEGSKGKKPIAFSGRVESVDLKLRTVAIKHGAIPGFMPAMTMDYPIDNEAMLKALKPDDKISATVYVGDPTLHGVYVLTGNTGETHR